MTTATISDQEFERIHNQLIDLKSQIYLLDDRCKRQEIELTKEKQKSENLEKELTKYQSLAKLNPLSFAKSFQLNKNKEQKEASGQLQLENEHLQHKIQLQEDEFRLTNDTLRQEIGHLLKQNQLLSERLRLTNQSTAQDQTDSFVSNNCDKEKEKRKEEVEEQQFKEIELILKNDASISNSQSLSYAMLKEKEQMESKMSELKGKLMQSEETNRQLIEDAKQLIDIKTQKIALDEQVDKLNRTIGELQKQIQTHRDSLDRLEKEKTEFKELSEKRSMLIDELRSEVEEISEQIDSKVKEADQRTANVKSELTRSLNQTKVEKKELASQVDTLNQKLTKLESVEKQNQDLNQEIEKLRKEISEQKVDRSELEEMEQKYQNQIDQLKSDHESKLNELKAEIVDLKAEVELKETEIVQLKQKIEDQVEERKIHEKRGVMYVRELKKQLNNEKKQKERLQEKFGDLLSESPLDVSSQNFETTSVGSWSFLSSSKDTPSKKNRSSLSINSGSDEKELSNGSSDQINGTDGFCAVSVPPTSNSSLAQNQLLEQENTMLVARITQLQQDKWMMEERLNQLTILNEEISNELQNKQKVISYYCMERRAEPRITSPTVEKFTVKKVVDFIKDKGDDNLKEINRKLQRMLEETLIKNMHLQTNLETLSKQLHEQSTSTLN